MTELKSCPFCGGKASVQTIIETRRSPFRWYSVRCDFCRSRTIEALTEEDAIEAWDRRAELEEISGKEGKTSPVWHTGTPTEEGWFIVKYECVCEGRYKGRIGYRAVRRKKDPIDGYIYEDGAIKADDVWKPIEWQRIEP